KVCNERLAGRVDENVAGLYISVNQPFAMSVVEGIRHCGHQFYRSRERWPGFFHLPPKIASFDELGDDEVEIFLPAAHIIDRNDVRMIQAGQDPGFGQVRGSILRVGNPMPMGNLNGYSSLQLIIAGQVNPSEAAFAQDSLYAKATDELRQLRYVRSAHVHFRP